MVGEILPLFLIIMGALETEYNLAMDKPLRILNIFNEFFGEDRVDMQGFPTLEEVEEKLPKDSKASRISNFIASYTAPNNKFILVHFPHVTITNEYDKSIEANELYAKVVFDLQGKIMGKFTLNRAEYPLLHFRRNYMHSHICNIPTWNFQEFQTPCTGSGPINRTICSLAVDFNEDLWRLFCLELDKFMCVESISGTPYHRLENVVNVDTNVGWRPIFRTVAYVGEWSFIDARCDHDGPFPKELLKEFIRCVIDSRMLRFSYDGGYILGMSATEYYTKISNLFIKWYNKKIVERKVSRTFSDLYDSGILIRAKFLNGAFISPRLTNSNVNYRDYIGEKICTFKGREIRLVIDDSQSSSQENNDVYLLAKDIADYIITIILNTVNFTYGNSKYSNSTHQEIRFL